MGTYNFDKKSAEEHSRISHHDGAVKFDGWVNVLTGLGMRGRDKNIHAHFWIERIFEQSELDQLYRSDGITRRIMDIVPAEMVRQGWEIEGDSDQKVNAKMEAIKANAHLITVLRWARLYGGALCVMGIADGLPLEEPVDEKNIRDVKWLHVFDRYQAFSRDGTFEKDLNSPNYGFPNVYTVNDTRTGALFYVHHSRILRTDWSILPPRQQNFNNGWGDPLIQSIYNELRNYSTAFANAGLIMQDFVNYTLSIPNLAELIASQCADNQVMKRLDLLNLTKGATNTMILDAEEKYEKASTNIAGIPELLDRFMLALSAVSGVPVSLLFGRSAAGMNATGDNDVRNFYDMVKQEQESKLKPMLEKLTRYIMLSKQSRINPERAVPYQIYYPLWVKECIHINNPFHVWEKFEEDYKKEHESLLYALSTRIDKNRAIFNLELKHLQDHIPQASLRDYWVLVNDIDRKAPYKMTIALLPTSTQNIAFSLFYSIPALVMWPLLYFFTRKKRSTQDLLSFQIGNFRKFYIVITILSAIYISDSPANAAFTTGGITLLTAVICNFIILCRSVKISWFLQGFLVLQACLLFYLIFTASGAQLSERLLAFVVCCLYLGSSLFILKNVRFLLLEEKKAVNSAG